MAFKIFIQVELFLGLVFFRFLQAKHDYLQQQKPPKTRAKRQLKNE